MQFHWENAGYADFEAFLAALASRKRKTIRRERRDAQGRGWSSSPCAAATSAAASGMRSMASTPPPSDRKWGSAYLTRRFFTLLGERLGERVVLMLARQRPRVGGRGAEPDRAGRALRPQLGLPRRVAVPAFRALLLPRHRLRHRPRASPAWRPARRASTRSSAATCRSRPSRRTGSRMPVCAARWPTSWCRSARRSRPRWPNWRNSRRSGTNRKAERCFARCCHRAKHQKSMGSRGRVPLRGRGAERL